MFFVSHKWSTRYHIIIKTTLFYLYTQTMSKPYYDRMILPLQVHTVSVTNNLFFQSPDYFQVADSIFSTTLLHRVQA